MNFMQFELISSFREVIPDLPAELSERTAITIGEETFEIDAGDLRSLGVLGRGAYGVVEKMRHKQSNTILAVKVIKCI